MAYILIIDDDPDLAGNAACVLRSAGYEVEIQPDTNSALRSMEQRLPDIILLDIMFPDNATGGFDFARALAKKFRGQTPIPILMLSSINQQFQSNFSAQDIDEEWMPVSDFMEKPVDFNKLKQRIAVLLEKRCTK